MSIYDAGFELADNADLYADGADVYITTGKEIDWVNSGLDIGQGTPIYLNITVGTTVYAGGTSVQFFLEVDDTSEGHDSTGKRVLMTDVILTADLDAAGDFVYSGAVPVDVDADRYLILGAVCAGTFTAGKVNAWLSNSPIGSTFNNQVAESNI
jgi:hypothetical protein